MAECSCDEKDCNPVYNIAVEANVSLHQAVFRTISFAQWKLLEKSEGLELWFDGGSPE